MQTGDVNTIYIWLRIFVDTRAAKRTQVTNWGATIVGV